MKLLFENWRKYLNEENAKKHLERMINELREATQADVQAARKEAAAKIAAAKKAAGPGYAEYEKIKDMSPEELKAYFRKKGREPYDKKVKDLESKRDAMKKKFAYEKKRNAYMKAWANKIMTKYPQNIKSAQQILMQYMTAFADDNHEEADKIAKTAGFQG